MSLAPDKDRLTVIINIDTKSRLKYLAEINHRSLSNYVVDILENHVKEENIKEKQNKN